MILPNPIGPVAGLVSRITRPGRRRRRVWTGNGRAHIEVRGVDRPDPEQFVQRLEQALSALEGVHWAEVNVIAGRVVAAYDGDGVDVGDLVDVIEAVEDAHGAHGEQFPASRPEHPGDPEPLQRDLVALGADVLGLGVSIFGRVLRATPFPGEVAAAIAFVDSDPRLRRVVENRLGRPAADLSLSLASAMTQAISQGPLGLLVDIGHRAGLAREQVVRRAEWTRREPELHGRSQSGPLLADHVPKRPVALPKGPIERYGDRVSLAALGAFGVVLAATRDPRRAGNALLAGVPKAARLGREAFAAQLDRVLAERGAIVMDSSVLRRLDRIDTVVLDASVLIAERSGDGVVELDGFAQGLAATIRDAGHVLVVAGRSSGVGEMLNADRVVSGGSRLAESVRSLQAESRGVLVISGLSHAGLQAADCGVGIIGHASHGPWGAHIFCGPGLVQAALVVEATVAARDVAKRSVSLAGAGSSIGAAAAVLGPGKGASNRAMVPVNGSALIAQAAGYWSAVCVSRKPDLVAVDNRQWHEMSREQAIAELASSESGLTSGEARRRLRLLELDGRASNESIDGPSGARGLVGAVAAELANPLTPVLAVGAGLSAAVGSLVDGALVAGVLAVNAALSGGQRFATERSIARLARRVAVQVRVLRDGREVRVRAEELVAGDVVLLCSGEVVPADCRLLGVSSLEVDESALTGESAPVAKITAATRGAGVTERRSMLYDGTVVVAGKAVALVVATGASTEMGRVLAGAPDPPASGVEARLERIIRLTLPVTFASGAAVGLIGALAGRWWRDAVGSGVSVMVAAVPEGLPLLATAAQLASARRLSGRGALVRNPRTIEALGRVDVLCFDKTGTLTEGRITLQEVSDGEASKPLGALSAGHCEVLRAAARACPPSGDDPALSLHATDRAVLEGARSAGVLLDGPEGSWHQLEELPFEPARGFHAVVGRLSGEASSSQWLVAKGAPEVIMPRCDRWRALGGVRPLDLETRALLEAHVDRMARRGLRVLAVAQRKVARGRKELDSRATKLELLGFVGLADPVRSTAARAVATIQSAGVRVVMVTGDHASTAEAVSSELGILDGHRVITGADLAAMTDSELDSVIADVSVFARVTPAEKVRIVRAYQRTEHVVAMTGDGANDAPAIRLADAGLAIGRRSTPAARQAADLVVTDERIETIVDAIVEGRVLWISVREALSILIGGNLGEVGFMLAGTSLSGSSPLATRQILLVNLLTDMLPALAVSLRAPGRVSPEVLLNEGPDASLGSALAENIAWRALATAGGATGAWLVARSTGTASRARTVGLVALVGTQLGQTLAAGGRSPVVVGSVLVSTATLAAIVQIPGVSHFFGCRPLGPLGWATALASATAATGASVVVPWAVHRAWSGAHGRIAGREAPGQSGTTPGAVIESSGDPPGFVRPEPGEHPGDREFDHDDQCFEEKLLDDLIHDGLAFSAFSQRVTPKTV